MTLKERVNFLWRLGWVLIGLGTIAWTIGRRAPSDIAVYAAVVLFVGYGALGVFYLATSRCPHCGRHTDLRGKGAYCPRCGKWIPLREHEPPG